MEKIKSGGIAINSLLDCGLNKNFMTCVIGAAGSGKTTFATQFLRRSLEIGWDVLSSSTIKEVGRKGNLKTMLRC